MDQPTLAASFQPNILNIDCGSRRTLELLADRWTLLVVHALSNATLRYSQLEHWIGGISQKMLTQTVRCLERDGLIERTVYPVVPPKVEYRLTPLGQSLYAAIQPLCGWAHEHFGEVEAARRGYDAGTKA